MAQEMDNSLLDCWINADRLPVPVIRALIEEVHEARQRRRSTNTVQFASPDPGILDFPLLELRRDERR